MTRYATLTEAREARAFERGWLPPVLPVSAVRIRESNDLDRNVGEGAFSFDPAELDDYLGRLRQWEGAVVVEQSGHWSASLSFERSVWDLRLPKNGEGAGYRVRSIAR